MQQVIDFGLYTGSLPEPTPVIVLLALGVTLAGITMYLRRRGMRQPGVPAE